MNNLSRESLDPKFDAYAEDYDAALAQGLSVTGESKEYFARRRIEWLAARLRRDTPRRVLDFGCGTGSATPYFFDVMKIESLVGIDVSPRSLQVARQTFTPDDEASVQNSPSNPHSQPRARFVLRDEYSCAGDLDLVFCNGVFHHIPPAERSEAVAFIWRALRPGGWFALWENNPWNPGTRLVMNRCPFDDDAQTIAPPQARRLLRQGRFRIVRQDSLFLFPHALRRLRFIESRLATWPLGAQYLVLGRK